MGTSLKDIAETLNLSKTTVSWVLSGRADEKGISAATQQRVSRCAQRLNYRPNLLARSLNTGESGMIGLILPSISDSFYSQVAREVEMEVEEHGYSLMICSSESEPERENRMIRLFRAKQVDGLIIAPTVRSGEEIRRLVDESFPFVVFDRRFPKLDTHCVLIDNERSSYALVRRLTEDGFRRIAVITTNPHLETMDARRAGYGRALADSGIAFDESLYGEVEFAGYERNLPGVLDRIFARDEGVDGFFFTTHILALEAFRYTGELLGRALADVVTVTSPEAIFLFGGLSKAGKLIFEPTQWYMEENMLFVFKNKVKLLPSGIQGKNAAILGASALIWQEAAR